MSNIKEYETSKKNEKYFKNTIKKDGVILAITFFNRTPIDYRIKYHELFISCLRNVDAKYSTFLNMIIIDGTKIYN